MKKEYVEGLEWLIDNLWNELMQYRDGNNHPDSDNFDLLVEEERVIKLKKGVAK